MGKAALYMCTTLSCFIVVSIIWEFMNEKYHQALKNKYVYYLIKAGMIMIITAIHILGNPFLNLLIWGIGAAFCAWFLYYDGHDKPFQRIIQCEVLLLCIGICDLLGIVCGNFLLRIFHISIETDILMTCFEMIFSKAVVIFLYYIILRKRMKLGNIPFSQMQYFIYFSVFLYTLFNILVMAYNVERRPGDHLFVVNLCCIVVGDLCLLYFARVIKKRNALEYEIRLLEKQTEILYGYYVYQEQKYNKTIQILHDINKHIKSIEQLYANQEIEQAEEYTEQLRNMLTPLVPVRYTDNPLLDMLLTDKVAIMDEKSIHFDAKIDNVDLTFIDAVDVTTIFGNLLDNAMEACEEIKEERSIHIEITAFYEMIVIRMKNSSPPVKWKNGFPVSEKGKNRGIGLMNVRRTIEKYGGDMKLEEEKGTFIVDIFLNS